VADNAHSRRSAHPAAAKNQRKGPAVTTPSQPTIASPTPGFAQRKARALIGWLPAQEGALWLVGRQIGTPSAAQIAICEQARAAVSARPPGIDQTTLFEPLPAELQSHIDALRADATSAQVLNTSGTLQMVDLTRVCAAQPQIHTEDARRRVEGLTQDTLAAIAQVTLPLPSKETLPVVFDPTKNAWILSSPNPNLRVVANFNGPVGPGLTGFGFAIALQKSYPQVAGLAGRYFLRDGYHRAYGFLAAGISKVPALVKDFATFEEVGLPQGLLPQSAYLGERPPLLTDYLSDDVSVDTLLPITQKMVVVQALELNSIE
jgi:hypothetical protein